MAPPTAIPVHSFGEWDRVTEWVAIEWVDHYKELECTPSPALIESLQREGFREPLVMLIGQKDRKAVLCEGNHRLAAAKSLGLKAVPVRVWRYRKCSVAAAKPAAMSRVPTDDYFPEESRPSDVFDDLNARKSVFVLAWDMPNGQTLVSLHTSKEDVEETIFQDVCGWWDDDVDGIPVPEDHREAIKTYCKVTGASYITIAGVEVPEGYLLVREHCEGRRRGIEVGGPREETSWVRGRTCDEI